MRQTANWFLLQKPSGKLIDLKGFYDRLPLHKFSLLLSRESVENAQCWMDFGPDLFHKDVELDM